MKRQYVRPLTLMIQTVERAITDNADSKGPSRSPQLEAVRKRLFLLVCLLYVTFIHIC